MNYLSDSRAGCYGLPSFLFSNQLGLLAFHLAFFDIVLVNESLLHTITQLNSSPSIFNLQTNSRFYMGEKPLEQGKVCKSIMEVIFNF